MTAVDVCFPGSSSFIDSLLHSPFIHSLTIPPMLSFAACARASPSNAPRPLLLAIASTASTAKHTAYPTSTGTRIGPSLVLCRFRHEKTIVNPRPSSTYKAGDFRPSYSKSEGRGGSGSYPRRSFGGEEFAAPWETTGTLSISTSLRCFKENDPVGYYAD